MCEKIWYYEQWYAIQSIILCVICNQSESQSTNYNGGMEKKKLYGLQMPQGNQIKLITEFNTYVTVYA